MRCSPIFFKIILVLDIWICNLPFIASLIQWKQSSQSKLTRMDCKYLDRLYKYLKGYFVCGLTYIRDILCGVTQDKASPDKLFPRIQQQESCESMRMTVLHWWTSRAELQKYVLTQHTAIPRLKRKLERIMKQWLDQHTNGSQSWICSWVQQWWS